MALCDDCFEEFVHPLIHAAMSKNEAFFQKYGRHQRWGWDNVASTLTFSDSNLPTVAIHCSVVGTTEGDSWEWSDTPRYPLQFSQMGLRIGVNYVVYAMTH